MEPNHADAGDLSPGSIAARLHEPCRATSTAAIAPGQTVVGELAVALR